MVSYVATIFRFAKKGEKTGWTYIEIPEDIAQIIFPGNKKTFRVKGMLDNFQIKQTALLPLGDGKFIMPLNDEIRKGTGKKSGDEIKIEIEIDRSPLLISPELLECLNEEPKALSNFNYLAPSHQRYFSNWINEAKTFETKAKRIAMSVNSLLKGYHFGEMLREQKGKPLKRN